MKKKNLSKYIRLNDDIILFIIFDFIHDPEVRYLPNGDPGHPSYTEIDVKKILWDNVDVTKLVFGLSDKIYSISKYDIIDELINELVDEIEKNDNLLI